MRRRLDVELVRRGLARSRSRAAELISAGKVTVGGAPATSAARLVAPAEALVVVSDAEQFASRAGRKLAAALDRFGIDPAGLICLDAGASTGGFTDCLLQRGAQKVTAVDVGAGQLDWALRNDERVEVRERTNVRHLRVGDVEPPVELVVADLSFISLRAVVGALMQVASRDADFVLLIKPQFEAGPHRVGKGGVVRSAQVHFDVLVEVIGDLADAGLAVIGLVASPVRGARGNQEFLAHARIGSDAMGREQVGAVVASVHGVGFNAHPDRGA